MIVIVVIAILIAVYAWHEKTGAELLTSTLCDGIIDGTLEVEDNGDGTYNIVQKTL